MPYDAAAAGPAKEPPPSLWPRRLGLGAIGSPVRDWAHRIAFSNLVIQLGLGNGLGSHKSGAVHETP